MLKRDWLHYLGPLYSIVWPGRWQNHSLIPWKLLSPQSGEIHQDPLIFEELTILLGFLLLQSYYFFFFMPAFV